MNIFEAAAARAGKTDPLRTVWDALDAHDCHPHGGAYSFRARCPAHDGTNPSALYVYVTADGQAGIKCWTRGCDRLDVARAIGLDLSDLYPPGHRRARRHHLPNAQRSDFTGAARRVVNILAAERLLGRPWQIELRADCPHCGAPGALFYAASYLDHVVLSCPGDDTAAEQGYAGCTYDQAIDALAAQLKETGR